MDLSFIKKLVTSTTSKQKNLEIKENMDHEQMEEIAELDYETIHGKPLDLYSKIFIAFWSIIWFGVSAPFILVGVGIIFWIVGLKILYSFVEEFTKIETFYLNKSENMLIKETIAFSEINRQSWNIKTIRKILIGLDVDISSTYNQTTGMNSTTRTQKYLVTMILDTMSDDPSDIGSFETIEILETKIDPRLLELCLDLGSRFENLGIPVERMVNLLKVGRDELVCRVCDAVNISDSTYCSTCGTTLEQAKY